MNRPLALHLPDADSLTGAEVAAAFDLAPAAFLVLVYAKWQDDKGVAEQTSNLVRSLSHDRLYVRFHADPHPPGYAKTIGGPRAWGKLCAKRMGQYYGSLGVTLHVILANEVDADYEGNLSPQQASDWFREAISGYRSERTEDVIHVPAPTGAPETHRRYLEQYRADGWVAPSYVIDGHGYDGDLENVVNVLGEVFPHNRRVITETNDLTDFGWPADLIRQGKVDEVVYFVLNWARGGIGRVQPPSADDAAKQMSLLRFPARYQQFRAMPPSASLPAPIPDPESIPMTEYETFIRDAAQKRGIDPDIAVRVANSEGSVTEPARLGDFSGPPLFSGKSWWAFQLHYGGEGYEYFGHTAGQGNGFTKLTGWAPGDPAAWKDATRYALNRAKLSGWGAWYGAAHVGIGQWDGIDRNASWNASSETWDYEAGVTPPVALTFNPDAPCDVQPDDWSCSIQATQWLLRSIGRNPGDQWMEEQLIPVIVSRSVGLQDASGQQMAAWINREYGSEMGFTANAAPVAFDDVLAGAGVNPTLIGGRAWGSGGHWAGVRRADEDGLLELANPAPGYTGVGTHLDRAEWDARGPWTAIYIDRGAVAAPAPVPVPPIPVPPAIDPRDARIAELEALVASLHADLDSERSKLGVLQAQYVPTLRDAVNAISDLKASA